jgi:hypothetical protein
MVRKGLKKEELKEIFVARVHVDQVPILKNLKGTVHIFVCRLFFIFFVLDISIFFKDHF